MAKLFAAFSIENLFGDVCLVLSLRLCSRFAYWFLLPDRQSEPSSGLQRRVRSLGPLKKFDFHCLHGKTDGKIDGKTDLELS